MPRNLYIINPTGNGGAGPRAWAKFQKLWDEEIDKKDIIYTKYPGHAIEIAKNTKAKTIVSVGGDGTVNEVMEGIIKNKATPSLGIIPAGTGNDVARYANITSLKQAVEALKKHKEKSYDLIEAKYGKETKYSFLTVAFGFSATRRIKPWMKRILGPKAAYYLAAFLEILLFKPWNMEIEWDNQKYKDKTTIVIIANVESSSGGSMKIGPGASPTDGKMTVSIIPFKSRFHTMFKEFPNLPKGEHIKDKSVRFFKTTKLMIKSDPRVETDIDGDLRGLTPTTVKILPKKIKIISR